MSLAARCPSCGTVFRVVQDQLRVSEGWVRCGRCAEVFNAIETLVDLDADAAARPVPRAASPGGGPGRERVLDDLMRVSQRHELEDEIGAGPSATGSVDLEVPDIEVEPAPAAAPSEGTRPAAAPVAPAFVVQADRAARWRSPGARAAMLAVLVLGTVLFAAQFAHAYRDWLAARWPATRDVLEPLCAMQGCRIEAPRAIEAIAVESSGLVRAEGSSAYRLSVVLRNRAAIALALPAIDLTLTDTQGAVIARRVIRPAEVGAAGATVPAAADLTLQAMLSIADRPISGYTIEIFYP